MIINQFLYYYKLINPKYRSNKPYTTVYYNHFAYKKYCIFCNQMLKEFDKIHLYNYLPDHSFTECGERWLHSPETGLKLLQLQREDDKI